LNCKYLFFTVLHLKPIQIRYQLWYRIQKIVFPARKNVRKRVWIGECGGLKLAPWIDKQTSYADSFDFSFLNQKVSLAQSSSADERSIDWNYQENGKLWAYNLNYMDYLLQPGMSKETGKQLIEAFITGFSENKVGTDPYPTALRIINWIKFFAKHKLQDTTYDTALYQQLSILNKQIEYHLLANHLLEDGFSLLFGAFYFKDISTFRKAEKLLSAQMDEQVLDDGGHFELSPMYHQILLDRLLDCINLLQHNAVFPAQDKLLQLMEHKTEKMLAWLNTITFSNGYMPLVNDAAPGIAPEAEELNRYAERLEIVSRESRKPGEKKHKLHDSGYRKFITENYECLIDIGKIGPSYQPGHAHADTFNFVLYADKKPLLIDIGISTYEPGETRLFERSTAAHNTVTVNGRNSSEIWSSFRVAHRASVTILEEQEKTLKAQHDGYKRMGTVHQRAWNFSDNKVEIIDELFGKIQEGTAHFWFSPDVSPVKKDNSIVTSQAIFYFSHADSLELKEVQIPNGYNQYLSSHKAEVRFTRHLTTNISIQ